MMQNHTSTQAPKATIRRAPQRNAPRMNDREKQISAIVGQNVRTLRAMASMSQNALAELLGITFQQVQKYEMGTNRISAPKLVMMAEIFNVPISRFFSNIDLPDADDTLPTFGKQGLRAAKLIEAMPPKVQGAAIRVLETLGEE